VPARPVLSRAQYAIGMPDGHRRSAPQFYYFTRAAFVFENSEYDEVVNAGRLLTSLHERHRSPEGRLRRPARLIRLRTSA